MEPEEFLDAKERSRVRKHSHNARPVQNEERTPFLPYEYATKRATDAVSLQDKSYYSANPTTKRGSGAAFNPSFKYDSQQIGNIQNVSASTKNKLREIYYEYTSKRTSNVEEMYDGVGKESVYVVSEKKNKNKTQELLIGFAVLLAAYIALD